MWKPPQAPSIYKETNMGKFLYDIIIEYQPETIVEFATYTGYSTLCFAQALRDLGRGKVISYDVRCNDGVTDHEVIYKRAEELDCRDYIELKTADYYEWIKSQDECDLFFMDMKNEGILIKRLPIDLKNHLDRGKIIVFEGGTDEHDKFKYQYERILPLKTALGYQILWDQFPGMSIMTKQTIQFANLRGKWAT